MNFNQFNNKGLINLGQFFKRLPRLQTLNLYVDDNEFDINSLKFFNDTLVNLEHLKKMIFISKYKDF